MPQSGKTIPEEAFNMRKFKKALALLLAAALTLVMLTACSDGEGGPSGNDLFL